MRRKQQTTSSDHHCPARNSCGHFQREPRKQHTETKKKKNGENKTRGNKPDFTEVYYMKSLNNLERPNATLANAHSFFMRAGGGQCSRAAQASAAVPSDVSPTHSPNRETR